MGNQQDLDKQDEELRMLYQLTVDDIKWAKVHQFRIVYYILLIFAAVIIFYDKLKVNIPWPSEPEICLLVIVWSVSIFGLYHIMDTQKSLCLYRMRILEIKQLFSDKAKSILEIRDKDEHDYTKFTTYYFHTVTLLLTLVIMIGVLLVICFLKKVDGDLRDWVVLVSVVNVIWLFFFCWSNHSRLEKLKKELDKVNSEEKTV